MTQLNPWLYGATREAAQRLNRAFILFTDPAAEAAGDPIHAAELRAACTIERDEKRDHAARLIYAYTGFWIVAGHGYSVVLKRHSDKITQPQIVATYYADQLTTLPRHATLDTAARRAMMRREIASWKEANEGDPVYHHAPAPDNPDHVFLTDSDPLPIFRYERTSAGFECASEPTPTGLILNPTELEELTQACQSWLNAEDMDQHVRDARQRADRLEREARRAREDQQLYEASAKALTRDAEATFWKIANA